jgi:hypothetical protein
MLAVIPTADLVDRSIVTVCMTGFDHLNAVVFKLLEIVRGKRDLVGKHSQRFQILLLGFLKLGRLFGWICVVKAKN